MRGCPGLCPFPKKKKNFFIGEVSASFFLSTLQYIRVKLYYTKHSFPDIPIIGGKPRFFSSLQPEQLFLLSFFFLGRRAGTGKNFFPGGFLSQEIIPLVVPSLLFSLPQALFLFCPHREMGEEGTHDPRRTSLLPLPGKFCGKLLDVPDFFA